MTETTDRADEVCEIAEQGFQDAIQIRQLVQLLQRQNGGGVNDSLNKGGAGQAAGVARNALIAYLVILVARAHSHVKKGDQHAHRAFQLLDGSKVKEEVDGRGSKELIDQAVTLWQNLQSDDRRKRIKHFRDKYTAHLGEPEDIPPPDYDELFAFARETSTALDLLARGAGVQNRPLDNLDGRCENSATEFWKPWGTT